MPKPRTTTVCAKCGAVHLDHCQACRRCGEPLPDRPANVTGPSAIILSRRTIKSLRMVLRLALNITRRSAGPAVQLIAGPDGLRIRCRGQQAAVEWFRPGELPDWEVTVAFELLPDCEGNNEEPVTIECSDDDRVLARWHDNGIPRVRQYDAPAKDEHDFPSRPNLMSPNAPGLLSALRDAMDSVDTKSLRNAINCVQADGTRGRLAATDSRQLILQNGFDFPWNDAVLIPDNKVFASPWLPHDAPVEIGKTDDWVTVCCGPWTIHLRLQAEGRFPNVDSVVPAESDFMTRLHFGQSDADFLAQAMKRMPVDDDLNSPVTLDLNGRVLVRATADDQPQPTELELTNSRVTGDAVRANTNRHLLTRAVRLGFREACFSGPETPVLCQDAHRRFVWMLLTKEGLIASSKHANRIASPADATPVVALTQAATAQNTHSRTTSRSDANTRPEATRPPENGRPTIHASSERTPSTMTQNSNGTATDTTQTVIEQAETLRVVLQDALARSRELINALKRQKKQSKTVQTALASLRQLQDLPA